MTRPSPTISSPLSAHKNKTITFDLIGIDRGFENPTFAALEVEYEDLDEGLVSLKESKSWPTTSLIWD